MCSIQQCLHREIQPQASPIAAQLLPPAAMPLTLKFLG